MKPDEMALLLAVAEGMHWGSDHGKPRSEWPHEAAIRLGIHEKRAAYLYGKWIRKGWFECGVSERTGWLTHEGLIEASKVFLG